MRRCAKGKLGFLLCHGRKEEGWAYLLLLSLLFHTTFSFLQISEWEKTTLLRSNNASAIQSSYECGIYSTCSGGYVVTALVWFTWSNDKAWQVTKLKEGFSERKQQVMVAGWKEYDRSII